MLFPGLAVLYEAGLLLRGKPHPVGLRNILLPAALFLLLVLWIGLQSAAGLFPDAANPAWKMAGDALGSSLAGSISVNRDLTAAALLRLITGASVFWLALQLCRDAGRARALVAAIALIGAAYAAYGLIAAKTGWLRMPDMPQGGAVSATFINPDSYAAFAGIGFIATAGIFFRLCRRYGVGASGTPRQQMAALVEMIGRDGAPVLAGGFTILAALLLTGSRGGIAATGLAVVAFAVLARRSGAGREAESWPVLILGLVFVGGTGLLFGTALADKIAGVGFFDPNRLAIYRLTLQSIFDRPWFGWGYGTFVDVFPMYRDGSIAGSGTWSQAHNTYLEAVQGLGIVFGSIFVALVALLVFRCFKGAAGAPRERDGAAARGRRRHSRRRARAYRFQLADSSRRVDRRGAARRRGRASGKLASFSRGRIGRSSGPRRRCAADIATRGLAETRLTALVVVGVVRIRCVAGLAISRSPRRGRGTADETRPGSRPGAIPGTAGETARRWLGIPGLGRSAFDLPLAQIASIDPEMGEQRAAELTALLAARPLSSQAWLSLAVFRLVARERPPSVLAALRLSWLTGPNEGSVLWQRGVFGLALWDFLAGRRARTDDTRHGARNARRPCRRSSDGSD